jgi:hypothetical protein
MKSLKTANGVRRIEDSDVNVTLFKLREILHEHRSTLIARIVADPLAYTEYRFNCRPAAKQLENIKYRLLGLKETVLDLERYDSVVQHVLAHDVTSLNAEPFFKEIDVHINLELNAPQLRLVK